MIVHFARDPPPLVLLCEHETAEKLTARAFGFRAPPCRQVEMGPDEAARWRPKGYLANLDQSVLPLDKIPEESLFIGDDIVSIYNGSTLLAYNTDAFPGDKAPKNVSDIFDAQKFPGKTGYRPWLYGRSL